MKLKAFLAAVFVLSQSMNFALASVVGQPPTFARPVAYGADRDGAQYVVIGDVLHRGVDDLVVTHANNLAGYVSLLLGTGRGTFRAPQTIFSGTNSNAVVVAKLGDVNGDGFLDLVMLTVDQSTYAYYLTVALGDGKGHFTQTSRVAYPYGNYTNYVPDFYIGKFGPDRFPDIFVQQPYGASSAVFRSNGHGGLSSAYTLAYGGGVGGLVPVDVNHDGRLDLVGIGQGPSAKHQEQLQTLFGTGDARFFAPPVYTLPGLEESQFGTFARTAAAADLRGDGNTDLIVFGSEYRYGVPIAGEVYLGRPGGSYDPPLLITVAPGPFGVGGPSAVAADFNGDGIPDVVLTTMSSGSPGGTGTFVLTGAGDGTFPVPLQTLLPVTPLLPHVAVASLVRGDKRPAIVISDQTANAGVWVLLNTSNEAR